jgi:hypothetical protein
MDATKREETVSQSTNEVTQAFRRHFDESELRQIDHLMDKFAALLARGLVTRKLGRWASVVHFRATQLATADGFAFSAREVAKIKGAYWHAYRRAAREADKILARNGLTVDPSDAP